MGWGVLNDIRWVSGYKWFNRVVWNFLVSVLCCKALSKIVTLKWMNNSQLLTLDCWHLEQTIEIKHHIPYDALLIN